MKLPRVLLYVLVTLVGSQAFAQNAPDVSRDALRYEATVFAGYRAGGTFDIQGSDENGDVGEHFSYALAFDYRIDPISSYELFYSRQPTQVSLGPSRADLDVGYLMFGGTLEIDDTSSLRPYIVGLVGAGLFSPHAPDTKDESRVAIALGLGLRVPLKPNIDMRLEARGYMTFFEKDSSVFCKSDDAGSTCLIRGNGSVFFQGEVLAGIAVSF